MKEKDFILKIESQLRKKSIFINKNLIDYKVLENGDIKVIYTVNLKHKKIMLLNLSDLGIYSFCNIVYPAIIETPDNQEYIPFDYLIKKGVINV